MSGSPGIVDFAIRQVNPVLKLPEGQVKFLGKFKLQNNCNQSSRVDFKLFLNQAYEDHLSRRLLAYVSPCGGKNGGRGKLHNLSYVNSFKGKVLFSNSGELGQLHVHVQWHLKFNVVSCTLFNMIPL